MSILLGNGGVKEVKEIYVGVDGKPRKVKDGYIGVDGTPRKFYSAIRPLEEYSWAEIRRIADAGLAPRYFKLGDMKSVHIQGTVGKLEVNNTFYVYILGFDHNGAKNTIDFGTFKTADGKDICLIDGQHSRDSEDGTKWFNMNHSSNTNAGGWKSCDLRYDILGSVNAKDRQNASSTTATSPVSNTLMAALPSDLRSVMAPMTIYTDNHGQGSNTAGDVTTTVDYLPLLAEFEIYGARSYANVNEWNRQAQYDYFKTADSKIHYKHSNTGSTAWWWERSPVYNTHGGANTSFCYVSSDGLGGWDGAYYSFGLAPIFRV